MMAQEKEVFDLIEFQKNQLKPDIHPQYKNAAHIEQFNRHNKAIKLLANAKFALTQNSESPITYTIAGQRAKVPSQRPGEEDHYCTFQGKLDCDCTSFIYGNVHDPNFECYHIMAARMFWKYITTNGAKE